MSFPWCWAWWAVGLYGMLGVLLGTWVTRRLIGRGVWHV